MITRRLMTVALLSLVAGCIFPLSKSYYELYYDGAPLAVGAPARPVTVAVQTFGVGEEYDRRELVLRKEGGETEAVKSWQWLTPPGGMMTRLVAQCCQAAQPFSSTASITTGARGADYTMQGEVIELITRLDADGVPRAVSVQIDVDVRREAPYSRDPGVVVRRIFRQELPIADGRHESIARTMSDAVAGIVRQVLEDVRADTERRAATETGAR